MMDDDERRIGVLTRLAVLEAEIECASYVPEMDDLVAEDALRVKLATMIARQRELRLLLRILDAREARR